MNLENLDVQEMNAQEVKNIDGGFFAILGAIASGIAICAAIDSICAEYQHGWNNPR